MRLPGTVSAFVAGALLANTLPHLASGLAGRRHMVPWRRGAGPAVNLVWAAANLGGGAALLHRAVRDGNRTWDRRLLAFEIGAVALSGWMLGSEIAAGVNHASAASQAAAPQD